jgi:hypothetical protein
MTKEDKEKIPMIETNKLDHLNSVMYKAEETIVSILEERHEKKDYPWDLVNYLFILEEEIYRLRFFISLLNTSNWKIGNAFLQKERRYND